MKKKVLFLCTHNSVRSQMAEGLLRALFDDRYEVYSAGTQPTEVNPYAVNVMTEIGIDISGHEAKNVEKYIGEEFDYVITVCDNAKETCPIFPKGKKNIHKGFEDPSSFIGNEQEVLDKFRQLRNEITGWIKNTFGDYIKY